MKFSSAACTALFALAACASVNAAPHAADEPHAPANATTAAAAPAGAANATTTAAPTGDIGVLLGGLKAIGNFTILAELLGRYPEEIGKIVAGDNNVTLLAPNDAALNKVKDTLAKTPKDALFALLSYHVVIGNYPSKGFSQDNHTVVPTMLTNETYVNLGDDVPQKVVISKNAAGVPVIVTNEGNITFVKSKTDISTGKLSLYPINGVLNIPGNLSTTLKSVKDFSGLNDAISAANLSETLNAASALTIFAPTNEALSKAQDALRNATGAERVAAFSGHILNGTVAYGSDLQAKAAAALKDMSTMIDNSTHLVGTLIAAGGQSINLTVSMDGALSLVSGNYTAKIVSTDHLYNGGVVHGIDHVLLNTKVDPEAAAKAAATNGDATGAESEKSAAAAGVQVNMAAVSVFISGLLVAAGLALVM